MLIFFFFFFELGTRVVKTLFEERRIHRKIPYYTCITAKKSMPDMPMGAVYSIQSRTCITRVSKDKVHVLVTFQVVFSKTGLVSCKSFHLLSLYHIQLNFFYIYQLSLKKTQPMIN